MSFFEIARNPDRVVVGLADRLLTLQECGEALWQGEHIEVTTAQVADEWHVLLAAPGVAVQRIGLRWQVRVPQGLRYLGDHWERGYGDMEWRGLVPERVMPWYFLSYDGEVTHGYGVKTGARAFCFWQVDNQGVTLWLDVRNGGVGVELGERVLHVAEIVTRAGQSGQTPFATAQAFCRLLCPKPVLPAHPVYGGNNWYYAYGNSSHQEIVKDSRLIASLAPQSENRPYMVIDDGWQQCHIESCNGGPWRSGNYLFPDMHGLAQEMRATGVRPGIWFRPLLTLEKTPAEWQLPGNRVHHQAASLAHTGLVLDPSQPAVLEHIQDDVRCMVDWGFELIKHDFSTYDILGKWGMQMRDNVTFPGWSFRDRSRTTAEIVLALYQAIAEAAGSEALILGCNTIGHLAAGIFALQRTGDDTSGREWERTRKYGVNTLAFRMPQHNAFFAVDADCIGLTSQIDWHLNRQWLDVLARSGTPLFVSAAPDAVGPEQEEALRAAFAFAADVHGPAEPLDWLDSNSPASWRIDTGEVVNYDWYSDHGVLYPFA